MPLKKLFIFEEIMRSISMRYLIKKNNEFTSERAHRMAVFANDWIGAKIFLDGIYEREQLEIVRDICFKLGLITDSSVALDVGANIGNHSIYFSKFFNEVIAYEANPNTFKILDYNSSYTKNVIAYNKGAGDKNETLVMNENTVNFGASSAVYESDGGTTVSVNISPLDELVGLNKQVDLVKIDVEGMEYKVLLGSKGIIDKYQPVIVFEQHENEFIDGENDTLSTKLLRESGYSFLWLEDKHMRRGALLRRTMKLMSLLRGRKSDLQLVYADIIPRKTHTLIIALPEKFSSAIKDLV